MTPQDLFPHASTDRDGVAKMREWLASAQDDLAEYREHKGQTGYHFGRGFKGDTLRTIERIEQWLKLVEGI